MINLRPQAEEVEWSEADQLEARPGDEAALGPWDWRKVAGGADRSGLRRQHLQVGSQEAAAAGLRGLAEPNPVQPGLRLFGCLNPSREDNKIIRCGLRRPGAASSLSLPRAASSLENDLIVLVTGAASSQAIKVEKGRATKEASTAASSGAGSSAGADSGAAAGTAVAPTGGSPCGVQVLSSRGCKLP